jgi:hypothetical protein
LTIELVTPIAFSSLIVEGIVRFQKKFRIDILRNANYKIYRLKKTNINRELFATSLILI